MELLCAHPSAEKLLHQSKLSVCVLKGDFRGVIVELQAVNFVAPGCVYFKF